MTATVHNALAIVESELAARVLDLVLRAGGSLGWSALFCRACNSRWTLLGMLWDPDSTINLGVSGGARIKSYYRPFVMVN